MKSLNAIAFLVVAGLLGLMGSVYVVNESQSAIVLQFGRIVRTDVGPGLHFKVPLLQTVRTFDRRILNLEERPERYLTSEKKDVSVDFFVKWRISDVDTFYRVAGGDIETGRQRLLPIVKDALRNAINQRTLAQVVAGGRGDVAAAQVSVINEGAVTLGIEVVDLRVKRIELPSDGDVLGSVYDRMRTERTQVANQLRAEGQEAAETIQAEARREAQVLLAEADRDAQTVRGEGDAEAAAIYAGAYGRDPEFYAFHRSLQAYREALGQGGTTLVLDPDSELLRYLEDAGQARPRN
jgi:membrane protease subunit HflC